MKNIIWMLGILVVLQNGHGMYFPNAVETVTKNKVIEIHLKKGGKKVFEFPVDTARMVIKTVHPERITNNYMIVKVNK